MKAGDKIVIVKPRWSHDKVGQVLTVYRVFLDGAISAFNPNSHAATRNFDWFYAPENFVTEEIFNSPLYQALL